MIPVPVREELRHLAFKLRESHGEGHAHKLIDKLIRTADEAEDWRVTLRWRINKLISAQSMFPTVHERAYARDVLANEIEWALQTKAVG